MGGRRRALIEHNTVFDMGWAVGDDVGGDVRDDVSRSEKSH